MINKVLDKLKQKVENFNGIIYGTIPIHVVIEMIEKAKVKYPETENEEELKAYLQNKDKETIIELYLQKEFDHKVELETKIAENEKHSAWILECLEIYNIDTERTPEYSENPIVEYIEQLNDFRLADIGILNQIKKYYKD